MFYTHGWYCVAFESEIDGPLHPVTVGDRRLMLVSTAEGLHQAYDADCPHRGAHLAAGKLADDRHVVCPYHGYRIGLGIGGKGLSVCSYPVMLFGGAVYVALSFERDNGWSALTQRLANDYVIAPGLKIDLHASAETVIENGFDRLHFHMIHGLTFVPFTVHDHDDGALVVQSHALVPGGGDLAYTATTISPGLIVVWLGGDAPYGVITGTTMTGPDRCTARLSYVIPRGTAEESERRLADLDAYSRQGLHDDDRVWRSVSPTAPVHWTAEDRPIQQFYAWCAAFGEGAPSPN